MCTPIPSTFIPRLYRASCTASSPLTGRAIPACEKARVHNRQRVLLWRRGFYTSTMWREEGGKGSKGRELEEVYDELTSQTSSTTAQPTSQTLSTTAKTAREEMLAKASVVFGSRLAGPAERQRELDSASTTIAGIRVPPRPVEPDNCCMSGCVNCVWDRYQDEVEDWAAKTAEARAKLEAIRKEEEVKVIGIRGVNEVPGVFAASSSMDDDGGGSEALWGSTGAETGVLGKGENAEDLMQGVPIGIREFMRNERRLKERKAAAAATA